MNRQQGFTLIEVLLVVLLIGIVSGIVLLAASPNDSSRLVASESERLAEVLNLVAEEAVNNNEQMGMLLDDNGYRFVSFDDKTQQWLPASNSLFAPYELPPVMSIHLLKDDASKTLVLTDKNNQDKGMVDKQVLTPQVLFLSSGETSAVVLELSAQDGEPQTVSLDDLGTITLSTDDSRAEDDHEPATQ